MLDVTRLIDHWTAHGIECPAGNTESEISDFEASHCVVLPPDVRNYLLAVNGMGERGIMDDDFFSFWALEDFTTVAEDLPNRTAQVPEASRYFMFADHSISLPTYAIRLSNDVHEATPVASVFADAGSFGLEVFYKSFTDFVERYLNDPHETGATTPSLQIPMQSLKPWWKIW